MFLINNGYENIQRILIMDSSKTHRINANNSFQLSLINFKVTNHNTCNNHLFYIQQFSQSYMLINHPINI